MFRNSFRDGDEKKYARMNAAYDRWAQNVDSNIAKKYGEKMPIRNNPCHDVVNPGGQVSYHDSPNKAKYLSDIIHKIVSEEKAQEPPETLDAPQVPSDAEKRLQRVLERLEGIVNDLSLDALQPEWVEEAIKHIIRQARGDIDESS